MKQKLAVVRTLMHDPKLVFLDEPTDGLDPVAAASLRDDLVDLARQHGVTVFSPLTIWRRRRRSCDQVAVINKGKLLTVGSPDDLRLRKSAHTDPWSGVDSASLFLLICAPCQMWKQWSCRTIW